MFGLDDFIMGQSDGTSVALVALVAILLGLRHATDPDHLAAVTTLVASSRERARRSAAQLGAAWGIGHGITLFAFGLPILLFNSYLPERVQQAAETAVGIVIVALAARLLVRSRRGALHVHGHEHETGPHVHLHDHSSDGAHTHAHSGRSPLGAFAIGLAHGMGGSAGVGVLIVAAVHSTPLAILSLALLAVFTAVSMTLLTTGFGATIVSRPVGGVYGAMAPALGGLSLAFGVWYAGAAWGAVPYWF